MKQIIVTVDAEGQTKIEAKGYAGRSCLDATRPIEEALGVKTADRQTPEIMYSKLPNTAQH